VIETSFQVPFAQKNTRFSAFQKPEVVCFSRTKSSAIYSEKYPLFSKTGSSLFLENGK
jgi:hypothetical protein